MWSDLRADAATRELQALIGAGLCVEDVHAHVLHTVARVVPFDAACVGSVDPDTLVLTSGSTIGFDPSRAESERFAELEYGHVDPTSFAELVERGEHVVHSGDLAPHRRLGVRYNELTRTMGFGHELRMTFTVDRVCWAVGDLYRAAGATDFDPREVAFISAVNPLVARATREAVAAPATASAPSPDGPAVLVMNAGGEIEAVTPAAQRWFDALEADDPNRFVLVLGAVASTVRAGAASASARLRTADSWVSLRAAGLQDRSGSAGIAVTVERADARERTDLLIRAHGLSARERDVCLEVLAGRSTQEIASGLFIAPSTVQDHLKSVFEKVGVRSRRELVALLAADGD